MNLSGCNSPLIGNGFCNDETNNAEGNYDGGDCCGINVNTEYCSDCKCYKVACAAGIVPPMVGDGICNDEANHPECNYDGGDCCGSCVVKLYCSDCECLGGYHPGNGVSSPSIGDGFCHDDNNVAECNYDGGDCCGSCVVKEYCSDCECLGGDNTGNGVSSPSIGDGFCHDDNNVADCDYDGFDCCGPNINTDHCLECSCHSMYF